jgi:hypothetical protein
VETTHTLGARRGRRSLTVLVALATTLILFGAPVGASSETSPSPASRPEPRVVDGTLAPPGSWPTVVALVQRGRSASSSQFCGGTVIDRSWILTAAHCLRYPDSNPTASQIEVLVGTQDLKTGGTRLPVAEIRVHSGWRPPGSFRNDVAVLRLASPVPSAIPRQALAPPDAAIGVTGAAAGGWGSTDRQGADYPVQLRQVSMLTSPSEWCAGESAAYDEATMVCAAGSSGAAGPCFGDSGGPLVTGPSKAGVQIGISSFVIVCADYPTYFTKVSAFSRWIDQHSRYGPHVGSSAFVRSVYRDLFGRQPTSAELLSGAASLDRGQQTPAGFAAVLVDGAKYRGRSGGVARLYQSIFLRRPETAGMGYWMGEITRGVSLKRIADLMVRVPEFTSRYGRLDDGRFVDLVYDNVLGRVPSAEDRGYWVGELQSGRRTRGQVMVGFSESEEYRGTTDPVTEVVGAFHGLIRRVPTDAELAAGRDLATAPVTALPLSYSGYAARF